MRHEGTQDRVQALLGEIVLGQTEPVDAPKQWPVAVEQSYELLLRDLVERLSVQREAEIRGQERVIFVLLHRLGEEFEDTHLSEEERTMLGEALEEERKGETVSLERLKRELGYG